MQEITPKEEERELEERKELSILAIENHVPYKGEKCILDANRFILAILQAGYTKREGRIDEEKLKEILDSSIKPIFDAGIRVGLGKIAKGDLTDERDFVAKAIKQHEDEVIGYE